MYSILMKTESAIKLYKRQYKLANVGALYCIVSRVRVVFYVSASSFPKSMIYFSQIAEK